MESGYKEGIYSGDAIFREAVSTAKTEDDRRKKELENIEFEWNDENQN